MALFYPWISGLQVGNYLNIFKNFIEFLPSKNHWTKKYDVI